MSIFTRASLGIILFSILAVSGQTHASDYFFRPLKASDLQNWTPKLEFQLVNPSEKTLMLKVSVRRKDKTDWDNGEPPLKVLPSNLLMKPGTHRLLKLKYDSFTPLVGEEDFEIIVEQVPVFFTSKGNYDPPKLMSVTKYTADVRVRRKSAQLIVYADQVASAQLTERPR